MKALTRRIAAITLMKPREQKAALAAFLMVFILMAVYFTLRPIRDAMASDWSDTEVSFLWNIQFFLSVGVVSLYSYAVSKIRFKHVVSVVYAIFAASFLLFYFITPLFNDQTILEKGFYLWVTSFSLLNLSVFWSFMSHTFTHEQGKRLFAFIGAGASAGALIGPAIPVLFTGILGFGNLMLIAALGLLSVIPIILFLNKQNSRHQEASSQQASSAPVKINGAWWTGFRDTVRNPYLLAIAAFILLYVFVGSFVYFQQKNLLAEFSRSDRAQILGGIDWVVNMLTFAFAFAITGRMVKYFGMGLTLASVPLALIAGFFILAFAPAISILLALQVVRRAGNYSVTRPAREMLFTQVSHAERFKAKPVIDVVVYRGGDAVSASLFALLTDGLGLGLTVIALVGSGIATLWAAVGFYLGRKYEPKHPALPHKSTPPLQSTPQP